MKCARCQKEIFAGYFGAYARSPMCDACYDLQMRRIVSNATGMSPMGDKESIATHGVTLDKVEPAVEENIT